MKFYKYYLISLSIIILDQSVKLLIHSNMLYGVMGQVRIFGNWFKLHYTLNPGMAFGMTLGGEYGKLGLSIFSILAMGGIGYYLYILIKREVHWGLCSCMALIFGGAVGNIIDRTFYGIWLNNAPNDSMFRLFHGQVIDMFYIDIWEGVVPYWIPVFGGKYYSLWPIFNIADASIFVGVSLIFIFQKVFFKKDKQDVATNSTN